MNDKLGFLSKTELADTSTPISYAQTGDGNRQYIADTMIFGTPPSTPMQTLPPPIASLTLNAATFHNITIKPDLVNFFYGNNGTGKTTIAREIKRAYEMEGSSELAWQGGKTAADYDVNAYNQAFIDHNVQNHSSLPGIFTIGQENIEVQTQIDEKTAQKSEFQKSRVALGVEKSQKESDIATLQSSFQEDCWSKAKTIREAFGKTQTGSKRKADFAQRVLTLTKAVEHDKDTLSSLYETAFDKSAKTYDKLRPLGGLQQLQGLRGQDLLAKSITSSANTVFAKFIKKINATDWVRDGHDRFSETEQKCPYCQQGLPDDFEMQLAACFDEQYQNDIDSLRQFQSAYHSDMQGFIVSLKDNLRDPFPKLNLTEYKAKIALFEKSVEANTRLIADKIKEPSKVVELENLTAIRSELNEIIKGFNQQIQDNNDIVNAKRTRQSECTVQVWELIAHILQGEIEAYKTNLVAVKNDISGLTQQISSAIQAIEQLTNDIADLNKQVVNTSTTMNCINNLLRDAGFQGFTLCENPNRANTYAVIRPCGTPAKGLSEGERNFIAFLYFYCCVQGSNDDSGIRKDKIVVIDDPVSSMDSGVLFLVSTLVREMIENCHANEYIKQIFVLTHNVYFHEQITYKGLATNQISFFLVSKTGNVSAIKLCEENPVKNSYAALWGELREVTTPISTINVIRRILEHYFMQLCGYNGANIRKMVLEEKKNRFIIDSDDSKYHLAKAMLYYIGATTTGAADSMFAVDDHADALKHKETFKLIFEVLGQNQHYEMMMNK